jgi:hypothetical protein
MYGIYWYDSSRCERDREDPREDLQQSKIRKKLYNRVHNNIDRNKEIMGLNKNELILKIYYPIYINNK